MLKNMPVDKKNLTDYAKTLAYPDVPEGLQVSNDKIRAIAAERWPYDVDHLLQAARNKTELSDFGEEPFMEALDKLCFSAETELDLSPVGRRNLYHQILDHLI